MLDWVKVDQNDNTYNFDFTTKDVINDLGIENAIKAVEYITQKYPPPYNLFVSGGVDSQAMLYAWHKSLKPFNAISFVYNFDLNREDLICLELFQKIHGINIEYRDFDLFHFLETEHHDYATRYICGSPQMTPFMKIADTLKPQTCIMSGNFVNTAGPGITNNHYGLWHYGKKSNPNFIPFFFLETKELAHSFKHNNYSQKFEESYDRKVALYQINGFPVIKQHRKMNGFEKIKEWFDTNSPRKPNPLDRLVKKPTSFSNRNFDLLYRNKYEVAISNYRYIHKC